MPGMLPIAVTRPLLVLLAAAAALSTFACGSTECVHPPCPAPIAILVRVTPSGSTGPVAGASVQYSGAATGTASCTAAAASSVCSVASSPGTYQLVVSAPGYQAAQQTVTAVDNSPACGCPPGPMTQIDVGLVPAG